MLVYVAIALAALVTLGTAAAAAYVGAERELPRGACWQPRGRRWRATRASSADLVTIRTAGPRTPARYALDTRPGFLRGTGKTRWFAGVMSGHSIYRGQSVSPRGAHPS
jgi:hypothetical protein